MLSIQTNVNSLLAQNNLSVNSAFQTKTIEQLTSGYRINSSSDDAAGLAVANQYRDSISELTQGVRNANDGTSQLQIIDGGLTNISQMLDRLQTLATESASSTFTGDRATLNTEYQGLLSEINRQADNIGLGANNAVNTRQIGVYIGGGQDANTNSSVNVDLTSSGVDANSLGIGQTNVLTNAAVAVGQNTAGGNTAVTARAVAATKTTTFYFETATGLPTTIAITGKAGDSAQSQVKQLNTDLQTQGVAITASLNEQGQLQFQSASAFSVNAATTDTVDNLVSATAAKATASNTGLNNLSYIVPGTPGHLQVTVGAVKVNIDLTGVEAANDATVQAINSALKGAGISSVSAVLDQTLGNGVAATNISFQGSTAFSIADDQVSAGTIGADTASTSADLPGPNAANPQTAIDALTVALASLGSTQGKVGAGENTIHYAINLAQSQITNFSAAQSQIRDADIAAQAANLSKAQVLQQSSIAAMAQANSAPQSILKLLQ